MGVWSYDPTDLATNEKDQIRLEISDTDSTEKLLFDQEITYAISVERNFWGAAARCMEIIARKFYRKADEVRLGRALQISYYHRAKQYWEAAVALRRKSLGTQVPWVGGMSLSDKINYEQNTDLVQPLFARTMMENPRTGGYSSDSLDDTAGEQVETGSV